MAGATTLEDPPDSVHVTVPLHNDGPALWPSYIDLPMLDQALRDNGTPIFQTMYQGRRGGLAGQVIDEAWFRYWRAGAPSGQCYMTVDPAISTKTSADETAIVIGNIIARQGVAEPGFDKALAERAAARGDTGAQELLAQADIPGDVYFRWYWHGRVGLKDTEDIIVKAWNFYRPVAIGIEAVAYQSALVQLLEADHPELPIEPVTPKGKDKLTRFLGLARLYEFGRVYHHPTMRASAFEYQLTHIPNGRHDDMADAATYLVEMAGIAGGAVAVHKPLGFR